MHVCRLLFTHYGKLLARCLSEGFGPLDFTWISFHLEVLMAFGTAKSKDLKWNYRAMRFR